AREEVAEAGDPEQRGRVEDVRADDLRDRQREHEHHHEPEERAAPDRSQAHDEPADCAERERDYAIAPLEQERRVIGLDAALEDRTVEDVRPDRERRLEAEDDHEDRRQQRAPAHPGHSDQRPDQEAAERELPGHRYGSINTLATSGRENSAGGSSPAASSSRTFVPDRKTWSSPPCGQVFGVAICPQTRQKNACSKNIGSISSSCGSNSSKLSCAS